MNHLDFNPAPFKEIVLEKYPIVNSRRISRQIAESSTFDLTYGAEQMYLQLHAYVWAEHKQTSINIGMEVPATWWDAFKLAHFPKWLLKKFPAKEKTIVQVVNLDQWFVVPEIAKLDDSRFLNYVTHTFARHER